MARAIAPDFMPELPDSAQGWRRTRRANSMFHAHAMGYPVCGARIYLDRNESIAAESVGDLQYHGVCPRCFKKGGNQ